MFTFAGNAFGNIAMSRYNCMNCIKRIVCGRNISSSTPMGKMNV